MMVQNLPAHTYTYLSLFFSVNVLFYFMTLYGDNAVAIFPLFSAFSIGS